MGAKLSRADFEAIFRRAGITPDPAQLDDIHANGWPVMEGLLERLRASGPPPSAEPALIFRPDGFGGEAE